MGPAPLDPVPATLRGQGGGPQAPREAAQRALRRADVGRAGLCGVGEEWARLGGGCRPCDRGVPGGDRCDRFFDDVCVFGPNEKVVKKGLYLAWETWCMDEGESDMGQNKFTRIMGGGYSKKLRREKGAWDACLEWYKRRRTAPRRRCAPHKRPANRGV
jgi:hypothetical protein